MPPFEYVDEQGEAAGTGVTRVRHVLRQAGYDARFVFFSVTRGESALQQHVDVTSVVAPSLSQRQRWRVSTFPLYHVNLGVVKRDNAPPIKALAALLATPYLAMQEMQFSFLLDRDGLAEIKTLRSDVTDRTAGLRLIKNHKADYFLTYFPLESDSWRDDNLVFESIETLPVHLVVFNSHPSAEIIMQKIDIYLAKEQKVKP